ncbi:hypothetical protein [Hymenobacter properus]|uniref:Uncharacterized protein n=1 Tax=Hymenobacter properus TaxID=2791026 RepID=A0A931FLG1_9BACT|nr:hypothetical protein [Hymenobacter properus]MBF9144163.1 hypothetical protein [Hymenobacter properus]MBR7722979.1 hypothetical protein [Microvirga sp. SRT04]
MVMLKNFQRYFRFYLATFLGAVLLVGIRWQAAPLGEAQPVEQTNNSEIQNSKTAHAATSEVAVRQLG